MEIESSGEFRGKGKMSEGKTKKKDCPCKKWEISLGRVKNFTTNGTLVLESGSLDF